MRDDKKRSNQQAPGRHSTGSATVRGWIFPLAIIALWCSPAVAINVSHGLEAGREPALIVAAVFSLFGAAMAGLRLETPGSLAGKAMTAACLAVLIAFNFSNAVGLSAGHRDHGRNEALTAQTARASLEADAESMAGTIARLDRELAGASVSSLKAEIAAAEYAPAFSRSKRCADATVSESRAHCAAWDRAKAMLEAAEQRDRLDGELAAIRAQLRAAPVRESVDPQSEAISQALAFAGLAAAPRDVGYGLVLLFALGVELMAAFGAGWCGVKLPGHEAGKAPRATGPATAAAQPSAPPQDAQRDPLAAFVADLSQSTQLTPFAALYAAYVAQCEAAGCEAKSERALGLALKTAGFVKAKADGGKVHYAVRLRPRLAVVAA